MKVKKLLHTRMRVSDMDQTINFYTNVLGLEVLERKVSPRGSHLAFLKVPNSEELIELCSFPPSGPVTVQEDLVHLAFQVENLDDTIDQLGAKQIRITDGPTKHLPAAASFLSMPRTDTKSNSSNARLASGSSEPVTSPPSFPCPLPFMLGISPCFPLYS